jgi:hypothetical protein
MNVTKTGIALVAFVFGCALSCVAQQLIIPAARAGTSPTRWEYLLIRGTDAEKFNEAGAQGWELTTANQYVNTFKRPLQ